MELPVIREGSLKEYIMAKTRAKHKQVQQKDKQNNAQNEEQQQQQQQPSKPSRAKKRR